MIFGKLELHDTTLETKNDDYVLASITAVSTRRPFLSAGLLIGALTGTFTGAFFDILHIEEIAALCAVTTMSLTGGWSIGKLQLVSRDLRGTPIADAVYGTYRDLSRWRPKITAAIARANSGGAS